MTVNWKVLQARLGITTDGVPGPVTYIHLLTKTLGKAPPAGIAEGFAQLTFNTIHELADFIAQTAHESAKYTRLTENLNYTAKRLTQVWPSRFPTLASANPYAMNARALANKVYGGRMGNINPDDGYLFRGRGVLQLTGRSNYMLYGLANNPDAAADPETSIQIAHAFYTKNKIWNLIAQNRLVDARKAVNGGTLGLPEINATRLKVLSLCT